MKQSVPTLLSKRSVASFGGRIGFNCRRTLLSFILLLLLAPPLNVNFGTITTRSIWHSGWKENPLDLLLPLPLPLTLTRPYQP